MSADAKSKRANYGDRKSTSGYEETNYMGGKGPWALCPTYMVGQLALSTG